MQRLKKGLNALVLVVLVVFMVGCPHEGGNSLVEQMDTVETPVISPVQSKGSSFPAGNATVTFTYNFSMGVTEITQGQYYDVMTTLAGEIGVKGSRRPSLYGKDDTTGAWKNLPVEQVSWYDAVRFCNALSEKEGLEPYYTITGGSLSDEKNDPPTVAIADMTGVINGSGVGSGLGYRLPTEAEWEYVAGGGSGTRIKYAGTDDVNKLGNYAWYENKDGSITKAVKTKQPNGLGMYDMSGNVYEWCWDWMAVTYPSANQDPTGAATGEDHVRRGGAYNSNANGVSIASRNYSSPSHSNFGIGFRVVRTVTP